MRNIFILVLFLINSCGYQPLYNVNKDTEIFKIKDVEILGDNEIGNKIYSKLPFILDKNNELLNKLVIKSEKDLVETSKNSKGEVTSYRTIFAVNFKLINTENNIISEKIINKEFYYNVDENKFKLREYQMKVEKNLIDKIIEDLLTHLSL